MFFICEQNGDTYGIKDTNDNIVEYYTPDQISKIVDRGIKIFGVFRPNKKTLRISVYDSWNNFVFLSNKDIMKYQMAGAIQVKIRDNKLTQFFELNSGMFNPYRYYAICISDLGIDTIYYSAIRDWDINLVIIIDSKIDKVESMWGYSRNGNDNIKIWVEDNTKLSIYKSLCRYPNTSFSPNLNDVIKKHTEKISNHVINNKVNVLFNRILSTSSQSNSYDMVQFINKSYIHGVDSDLLNNNAMVKQLKEPIQFNGYEGRDNVLRDVVVFTDWAFKIYSLLMNGQRIATNSNLLGINNIINNSVMNYFAYSCNYSSNIVKYAIFMRNILLIQSYNIDTSVYDVVVMKVLVRFGEFFQLRGFEYLNNNLDRFIACCNTDKNLKDNFLHNYVIDVKKCQSSNGLSDEQLALYSKLRKYVPTYNYQINGMDYFRKIDNSWLNIYNEFCLYYVTGKIESGDPSLFNAIAGSYNASIHSKLVAFMQTVAEEYGLKLASIDFNKFAIECMYHKNYYLKELGLPDCHMDLIKKAGKRNNLVITPRFYTFVDNSYFLYKANKVTYKDAEGKSCSDYEFNKVWTPGLKEVDAIV